VRRILLTARMTPRTARRKNGEMDVVRPATTCLRRGTLLCSNAVYAGVDRKVHGLRSLQDRRVRADPQRVRVQASTVGSMAYPLAYSAMLSRLSR